MLRLLLIVLAAAYGAVTGMLLPRALHRLAVPPGEPWRHRCAQGHPLVGWVGRARCARCGPGAHALDAAQLAALAALSCAALGYAVGPRPELVVWLLAAPVALLATSVDQRVHRLPDVLTLPLAGGTATLLGLAAFLPAAGGSWSRALWGGAALAGGYGALLLLGPAGGLGLGDVKLALTLGIALGWYGWDLLFVGTFLGFLLAAGWGTFLMAVRKADRKTAIAFGPFMVLGAFAGVLLGGVAQ